MDIWKTNKVIERLNKMVDNAIEGKAIENGFDESKMSALETKLAHFLASNNARRSQLTEEKAKIDQLISDISHQTKTPIANILLYAQLLSEGNLPTQDQSNVKALMEQAEKLNFLISSLVKISRLETGIISVTPKDESLSQLLDMVSAQGQAKAKEKSISFFIEKTDTSACFDLKWTAEALYNIVDNAIKYTPNGGSITISVTDYQLFCRIDVTDTGIGVSEGESAKIFSRFYRSPLVSQYEGVGIGLYLAREIISSQGGYIKLSSKAGNGSTFSVFLPL